MKIIDISMELTGAPVYHGDPEPCLDRVMDMTRGDPLNLSRLTACVHAGTHADSPLHFIPDGESVAQLSLERFIGRCTVASSPDAAAGCKTDKFLLKGSGRLTPTDVQKLKNAGIRTLGVETMSVGDHETHISLLGGGIVVIENLVLGHVEDGEYFLSAAPVKLDDSDGAFVRAVLLEGDLSV